MKIFLIGCGSIGARHASNLARLGGIELLFYDVDPTRSRSLSQQLGGMVVPDLENGLASMPDAVLICVPTHLHVPLALHVLKAGVHLFIEKPISHTLDRVDELIREAALRKCVLLVGCNLRFHRSVLILKRWLEEGVIGRPLFGRFHFGNFLPNWRPGEDFRRTYSAYSELGGGILLEGVHEIDYARWFLGEPDMIAAMTGQVSRLEIDTDDVAEILIRFACGALGEIHLDRFRPVRARSCELVGDEGLAVWRAEGKHPERNVVELHHIDGKIKERQAFDVDLNEMYIEEMKHFLQCVRGEVSPSVDGAKAKRVLAIALAAQQAANSGSVAQLQSGQEAVKSEM